MNANDLLQQMLEEALEVGATSIELEREPDGLEVSYMVGDSGFGHLISDDETESALFDLIFQLADLEERLRGTMEVELLGKPRTIYVQQYESFGETCLRLFLQKPQRGKKPGR
jgi:hypothetical protein